MSIVLNIIDYLGLSGKDRVTGFAGVVTSVCFDLYGCALVSLSPPVKAGDQEIKGGHWFDVNRVEIDHKVERVMPVPAFVAYGPEKADPKRYAQGAADKPAPR